MNAIWILIVYFAISAIGGWLSRQAKKAQEAERQRPRGPEPTAEERESQGMRRPTERPVRHRQSPEEIAAEIRRVMGFEREESRVEILEEVYDPPITSPPVTFEPQPDAEPDHGGNLHDRILAREAKLDRPGARKLGSGIAARHPGSRQLGSLAGRFQGQPTPRDKQTRGFARRRGYVDLADMARAFVTMEVLGKPLGLREDDERV